MFDFFSSIYSQVLPASDLAYSTWQTIYMVYIASFISIVLGTFLGLILIFSNKKNKGDKRSIVSLWVNLIVGIIVNIVRSIPFIILMISLIPFTMILLGTSIGTNAAIVSLSISAIAFYARIAESALAEVDPGLIEASVAMGSSSWQMIWKLYLPEALPSLIRGATLTIISLIGYSAMAGAIGGGGLGELAYNLGFLRFHGDVILITVVVLVILVQIVQFIGDLLAKSRPKGSWISIIGIIIFVAFIIIDAWPVNNNLASGNKTRVIKIGVMSGKEGAIYEAAKGYAKKHYNLDLKFVLFDAYTLPNRVLNDGEIQANIFQFVPYLEADIKAHGYKLSAVGRTFNFPIGFYSKKIKNISQLPDGALVVIASDPTNGGRELILMQKYGLIKVDPKVGLLATPSDIIYNPKHLKFKMLDAAILPRALNDAYLVAINTSFLPSVHLKLKDALLIEGSDAPYANVIVVRTEDKNKPWVQDLIASMHSKSVIDRAKVDFPGGAAVVAWNNNK